MPFPVGWPPRAPADIRSIRFFREGTATGLFDDSAYLFIDDTGANPFVPLPILTPGDCLTPVHLGNGPFGTGLGSVGSPLPMIWSHAIQVSNDEPVGGGTLEFSFDGVNVHGSIGPGQTEQYRSRYEGGIALRCKAPGVSCAFKVTAW